MGGGGFFGLTFLPASEDDKERGNEDYGEAGGGDHSAGDSDAEGVSGGGPGAGGEDEGEDAEDESERGHDDGAEAGASGGDGGFENGVTGFAALAGHFHDENGIFGGESDEEHETDLDVEIIGETGEGEGGDGAEDGEWDGEEDGEGEDPAFVLASEDEVDEDHGEDESDGGGGAAEGFLVGEGGPFEAHAFGEIFGGDFSHGLEGLAGAVAGAGGAEDGGGGVEIVEGNGGGTDRGFDGGEGAEGDHFSRGVGDGELGDGIWGHAEGGIGLGVDIESPSEAGELIDVGGA